MKVEKQYQVPFPVTAVYAAWISSETVVPPAKRMNIEPLVGGRYQLFMGDNDDDPSSEGFFAEVVPGRRLRYSWEWNKDGEVTEITVVFDSVDGETAINILHDGFTNPASVAMHDTGWDNYIEGFVAHIAQDQ